MELSASDLWSRILETARSGLPEQSFQTWLATSEAVALTQDELLIMAPSPFHQEICEDKFKPALEEIARQLLGRPLEIAFQAASPDRSSFPPIQVATTTPEAAPQPMVSADTPVDPRTDSSRPVLNDRYTFDRFVVGNNNQLAAAACHAVAVKPARMYNPLFLYGGVGLGKTHLMHAIGNQILKEAPGSRVMYVSSERFMNDLVNSIQTGTTAEFRRRYREMDLLLVDDVHFLEGKDRTQEEFFHTFNALYDAQKQIILTSDRPPKDIPGLEDRLVSRFEWGLVADIKAPDYETRVAILRKKAEDDHLTLDMEVIDFIAHSCTASVRELEGSVIKLLAYSSLTHQEITVDLAKTALSGMLKGDPDDGLKLPADLTPISVRTRVAERFGVKPEGLSSKRRTRDLTVPRQVAMYLIKELLDTPLVQIGEVFGGRDHSTVIHSIRKVEDQIDKDEDFREEVSKLRRELSGLSTSGRN